MSYANTLQVIKGDDLPAHGSFSVFLKTTLGGCKVNQNSMHCKTTELRADSMDLSHFEEFFASITPTARLDSIVQLDIKIDGLLSCENLQKQFNSSGTIITVKKDTCIVV